MTTSLRIRQTGPPPARFGPLLLGLCIGACSSLPHAQTPLPLPATGTIQLTTSFVESSNPPPNAHPPTIKVTLRNVGSVPLAICRCFGIRRTWLYLEIQRANDHTIADAGPEYDLFSSPPYQCLEPGQTITITKNLFHWYAEFGNALLQSWGPETYHLRAGSYRLRAAYYDDGQRRLRRCRTPTGVAYSEWLQFAVPNEEQSEPPASAPPGSRSTLQAKDEPPDSSSVEARVLVEASFEPAWMKRDAWTLRLLSDGSVVSQGRTLGHFRERVSQDALSEIALSAKALTETLDPASYTSIVEDADAIRLRIGRGDQVFEYRVEQPQSINCASPLGTLAQLWDLVILSSAPRARCNGPTCLLCHGHEQDSSPSAPATRPG